MSQSRCGNHRASTGLTLLELVVVLGVLAALTTVAVRSLEPIADQARYEQTRQQLERLRPAVVDATGVRQPDGSGTVSGFVADVGRLPVSQAAGTLELAELWDASLWTGFPFAIRSGSASPEDYSDIRLPCGWRGPYLQLPRPADGVYDGWGASFPAVPTTIRGMAQIAGVQSVPRPAYDSLQSDWSHAMTTVSGVLTDGGSPATGRVVLLYPDPTQSTLAVLADADGNDADGSFLFEHVPVGLRAVRATIGTETVTRYIQVAPGGLTLQLEANP